MLQNNISRLNLLVACFLLLGGNIFAQDSEESILEWSASIIIAGQLSWDFVEEPSQGISLLLVTTAAHKKWSISAFSTGQVHGAFINHQIDEKGIYGAFSYIPNSPPYGGLGFSFKSAALEIGAIFGNVISPTVSIGVMVNAFSVSLKKW